jgi:hypothetical protein
MPTGCAVRCTGSQYFVVPSAQRYPENWIRYPLHHSDSLDPHRVMEITFEVALAKASHGATKKRRKILDRTADVIVGISNSQR